MVRIGMGGGTSGSNRSYIPTTPANLVNRAYHELWVHACRAADIEHIVVELFAVGHSLRQIRLRRPRSAATSSISLTTPG